VRVRVLFFGPARSAAGVDECTVELGPGGDLGELRLVLAARNPELSRVLSVSRLAVNREFVGASGPLADGDEVAVIPPVSGGSAGDLLAITGDPLDAAAILNHVAGDPACGGVALFVGCTRRDDDSGHGVLVDLEYEAYGELAARQLTELASRARQRWPIGKLAIVHRTGVVAVGEPSVVVAAACPHRAEAFEACRWLIDTLKGEVAIWKKERWADNEYTWSEPAIGE